jgi:hypothetical protein
MAAFAPPPPNAWWTDPLLTSIGVASVYGVVYSACCSAGLFADISDDRARIDARSRVVSLLNVAVSVVAVAVNAEDLWGVSQDLEAAAFGSSDRRDFCLLLMTGFMLYDLCLMVWEREAVFDLAMVLHHSIIICALLVGVMFKAATFYMAVLFVNEVSTPFLNLRFLLLHLGLKNSALYRYNGAALVATFLLSRVATITALVCHGAYAWWQLGFVSGLYWTRPGSDRVLFGGLTALLLGHWALNLHWFYLICLHAMRVFRRGGDSKQRKSR